MMMLAGCSSLGGGTAVEQGVVPVNSYMYKVSAIRSKDAATDLEEATQYVKSAAYAFCAKQDRVVEIDTLARLDADMGRPASAFLRFRCIRSDSPYHPQS